MPPFPLSRVRWQVIPKSVRISPSLPWFYHTAWWIHSSYCKQVDSNEFHVWSWRAPCMEVSTASFLCAGKGTFHPGTASRVVSGIQGLHQHGNETDVLKLFTTKNLSTVECGFALFPNSWKQRTNGQKCMVWNASCWMSNINLLEPTHPTPFFHPQNYPSPNLSRCATLPKPSHGEPFLPWRFLQSPKWVNVWTLTCYVGNSNRISWNKKNMRTSACNTNYRYIPYEFSMKDT